MKNVFLSAVVFLSVLGCAGSQSIAQDVPVVAPATPSANDAGQYVIRRPTGESISIETMIAELNEFDAVLVGEEHDDPIGHAIQLQILEGIYNLRSGADQPRSLSLSLEMFTTDVQYIVDEYLNDLISERSFRSSSNPWPYYETDYRPSVEFAKEKGLEVVAANAPRRYASRVTQNGPESLQELPATAKQWLPPLPYQQASLPYIAEWNRTMRENMHGMGSGDAGATSEAEPDDTVALYPNMLAAQSLWDATMAYSIADALMRNPGGSVLHFVGAFHVENRTGIPEHLLRYRPGTKTAIVSMRAKDDLNAFDRESDASLGDYIIVTDAKVPRSHVNN